MFFVSKGNFWLDGQNPDILSINYPASLDRKGGVKDDCIAPVGFVTDFAPLLFASCLGLHSLGSASLGY